jgi:YVTN family beta-propeller protein
VAVIDIKTNKVVAGTPVGNTPTAVAADDQSVWVLNSNEGTLSRIDPETRAVVRTVAPAAIPTDLAIGAGGVWVGTASHAVKEIDEGSSLVVRTITLPVSRNGFGVRTSGSWVAADRRAVWATSVAAAARLVPGPRLNVKLARPGCCTEVALGEGGVWVADSDGIDHLAADGGSFHAHIKLPFSEFELAAGAGAVWATDQQGDSVWRIDPIRDQVVGTVHVGLHPAGVAIGAGSVWVAATNGVVSRIDPSTNRVVQRITVGGTPRGVAVGAGAVWITVD